MENPWKKLPSQSPYVLSDDRDVLSKINRIENFEFDILPEPFLGSIDTAKVILLNLNPGFDDEDGPTHSREDFIEALQRNLQQVPSECPFYPLDPRFSDTPVYKWWNKKLRELIEKCGRITVSKNVACIEFFPYHSLSKVRMKQTIPSQQYNFYIVRQAMKDNKTILIMRARREWFSCIPELEMYPYLLGLNSSQNVSVSKKNVSDNKFDELVQLIGGQYHTKKGMPD